MPLYPPGVDDATGTDATGVVIAQVFAPVGEPAVRERPVVGPPPGMLAVAAADLVDSGRGRGGGALVAVEGSALVRGEAVVFCQPVVTAAVVLRRDGRVQAGGWLRRHRRYLRHRPHLAAQAAGNRPLVDIDARASRPRTRHPPDPARTRTCWPNHANADSRAANWTRVACTSTRDARSADAVDHDAHCDHRTWLHSSRSADERCHARDRGQLSC